eukprot:1385523-Amorphochlora_amoeboformis.AAC.1
MSLSITSLWLMVQTTNIRNHVTLASDAAHANVGTGGTIKGVGTVLRKEMPKTKIVACEPKAAPMMYSEVPMQYHEDGSFVQTHPVWKPHPLQGWV